MPITGDSTEQMKVSNATTVNKCLNIAFDRVGRIICIPFGIQPKHCEFCQFSQFGVAPAVKVVPTPSCLPDPTTHEIDDAPDVTAICSLGSVSDGKKPPTRNPCEKDVRYIGIGLWRKILDYPVNIFHCRLDTRGPSAEIATALFRFSIRPL